MSEESANYVLDAIREEDAPVLAAWFNDPSLGRYMEDSEPDKTYSPDDVFSMIREPGASVYLTLRHQNTLVGYASFYDFRQETAEFSFLIGNPEFRGRRVGGLLVRLLCDKAKALGLKKLTCSVLPENQPSIRCVQKNGFAPLVQGQVREFFFEKHL